VSEQPASQHTYICISVSCTHGGRVRQTVCQFGVWTVRCLSLSQQKERISSNSCSPTYYRSYVLDVMNSLKGRPQCTGTQTDRQTGREGGADKTAARSGPPAINQHENPQTDRQTDGHSKGANVCRWSRLPNKPDRRKMAGGLT